MSSNQSRSNYYSSSSRNSARGSNEEGRERSGTHGTRNNGQYITCVICSERYNADDQLYAGSCGHVFHWDCLQRWWAESMRCPICRKTSANYFQIYLNFEELAQSQNTTSTSSSNQRNRQQQQQQQQYNQSAREMNDYENLLYEAKLYRDEIDYLNTRITHLTLCNKLFNNNSSDSD